MGGSHPSMRHTQCPLCETDRFDREVFPMNFQPTDLNGAVFSARRLPDRLHYRMVRCRQCSVLRSDPILPTGDLARLYEVSRFTYGEEAMFARKTYAQYLRRALPHVCERRRLMEIGCGNGFFLQEARALGFQEVWGVEPGTEAVGLAPADIRGNIRVGLYDAETFPPAQFDIVCAFQVLDHVPDPVDLLRACYDDLVSGGVMLCIMHDAGALTARVLGERSPIVDVEHTALFDKRTIRHLFGKCGFEVREVFSVRNTYPLRYWAKLAPLPGALKRGLLSLLDRAAVGGTPITLSAGNLGIIASRA